MPELTENVLSTIPDSHDLFVVGIGASAGGVETLIAFFKNVKPDSGMAYVVILHLSPKHESRLDSILSGVTPLRVTQVTETIRIEQNHIYVVSPNHHLTMSDGTIVATENTDIEERRAPVDIFFRTLAESHTNKAIAIILSGTGANGSMGIKRIKERGGAVFVQDPGEAIFNEMPRNSIATGLIDDVLKVAEMPARILAYRDHLGTVEISVVPEDRSEDEQQALREIFVQLRVRTGHDFTNYKRPTLLRRIERRINICSLPNLAAYAAYVRNKPEETQALLKDLLISVTNFFRDKTAFEYVEKEVLPKLIAEKKQGEALRIWVAGCATGEEAYSLAMLCAERMLGFIDAPKLQVFATDIDENAIAHARDGIYTINDAADVSPERLRRYFAKEGEEYRVRREIREMILFASHNVIKDPPFSHIDLISCRNMLIYLNQAGQERVMETFHFALNPGGYLFLGNSESADGANDLYVVVNREFRLYQSRAAGLRSYPVPESVPGYKPQPLQSFDKLTEAKPASERISYGDLHQQLLEQYAPPSVIVNEEYELLHLSENAGRYLQVSGGEPSRNLLKLVRPELRLELRSALYQAVQKQANAEIGSIKLYIDNKEEFINIHVRPVLRTSNDTARGFILVVFAPGANTTRDEELVITVSDSVTQQLEDELQSVKQHLRTTSEQYELQAEEMKASNEELQALNEELRSAAEELETSKEELQSINEELRTVNQELKVKIDETSIASNNLQNFINSTDIGTIFLDRGLRVNLFTPATRQIYNLIPSDYGRLLTDITSKLAYDKVLEDAQEVIDTLRSLEKEVATTGEQTFLMRITPYRTLEDRINGVVISFIDITDRKKKDEALKKSEEKYRTLFESIDEGFVLGKIIVNDNNVPVDYRILDANPAYEKMTGLKVEYVINKTVREIIPGIEDVWIETVGKVVITRESIRFEHHVSDLDKWFETYLSPSEENRDGYFVAVFKDITERKRTEANLAFLADISLDLTRLTNAEDTMDAVGAKIAAYFNLSLCLFVEVDEEGENVFINQGWQREDVPNISGTYCLRDFVKPEFERKMRAGETVVVHNATTDPLVEPDRFAALKIGSMIGVPITSEGKWRFWMGAYRPEPYNWREDQVELMRELTASIWIRLERARAEDALQYSETRLRIVARSAGIGTWIRHLDTGIVEADEKTDEIFGLPLADYSLTDTARLLIHPDDISLFTDAFEKAIDPEGNGILNVEFRILRPPSGNLRWLHGVGQTFFEGEPKKPVMMVGSTVDITERKEAERVIRQSEERYRAIFNQATAGVLEADTEGNLLLANETFCRALRYMPQEITSLTIRDITHADDLAHCQFLFEEAIKTGNSFTNEKRLIRSDGSCIWVTESIVATKDAEGNTKSIIAVGIDITERKKTELYIHESEARYRIALEAGELATWDWNLATDKVMWNEQHFKLFGINHPAGTIDSGYFLEFIHPEDMALVKQQLAEVVGERGIYSAEFRIRRKDNGKLRWMTGYGRVTERENGKPTRISGVMFDSTERREAEDNLEAARNSLSTALEAGNMGVWSMNMTYGDMDHSPRHDHLLGFASWQEEWVLEKAKTHMLDEDKPLFDAAYENLLNEGVFNLEARIRQTDGNTCWVHYYGRTFRDEDTRGETSAGVIYDITDQKTLEKQKDEFIGVASHELKTPVTSIKAYAEILQEMFTEKEDHLSAELMGKLDSQVDRLTNLIRDLLDVTKISEGQLHLTTTVFDMKAMIRDVTEDIQRTTRQHKIRVDLSSLPEVAGDKERLAQVLVNMLSNAIKYSPGGKEVLVTAVFEDEKVRVSVQDFGIGMSPGTLEKLFARFFRSDNPSVRSYPGLGLGLFISMEIMKRHSGTISVQSEQGKGSIFTMVLPVA